MLFRAIVFRGHHFFHNAIALLNDIDYKWILIAAIGISQSIKMPAQAANGASSSNPASPLGQGGVVESNSDDKFLFTSESVGEGHPGKYLATKFDPQIYP